MKMIGVVLGLTLACASLAGLSMKQPNISTADCCGQPDPVCPGPNGCTDDGTHLPPIFHPNMSAR